MMTRRVKPWGRAGRWGRFKPWAMLVVGVAALVWGGSHYKLLLPRGPDLTPTADIGAGTGHFVMNAYKTTDRKTIRVWTHRPANWQSGGRVLFVMHGMSRNAKDYLEAWVPLAERHNVLVIAPEFHNKLYRYTTIDYQDGNLFGLFGEATPRSEWAFQVMANIVARIEADNDIRLDAYDMFGHSAGGQFVHRLVLMQPDGRLRTAIAANAGVYSFPDQTGDYPYTLPHGYRLPPSSLAVELVVMVGGVDTKVTSGSLDQSPAAQRQGAHRLERGQRFFKAGQAVASRLGTDFGWRFHRVPDVGHDKARMIEAAAAYLYDR